MKTKEKLIRQAVSLILEKGYHGTGINEILRVSNVTKGSLYYHFPKGKDQLVTEALRSYTIKLSLQYKKLLKSADSLEDGLGKLINHAIQELELSEYKAGSILINVSQELGSMNKHLQATCKQLLELIINNLERFFLEYEIEKWEESARSFFISFQGAIVISKAYQETSFLTQLKTTILSEKYL
ncbi:MAG: TetR/AcrR family transcriptional regulator [Flavobacteriales bacterium]|nr:TetR/AcrR family transcriptional regulator [Flavobacteriales bacterium]